MMEVIVPVSDEVKTLLKEALFSDADEIQFLRNYPSSCPPQVSHIAGFSSISKSLHVTEDIIRERIMALTLDNDLSIEDKYLMNNYDGIMQMQLMTPPVSLLRPDNAINSRSAAEICNFSVHIGPAEQDSKTNDKYSNSMLRNEGPDTINKIDPNTSFLDNNSIRRRPEAPAPILAKRDSTFTNHASLEVSTTDLPEIPSTASISISKGYQQNEGNSSTHSHYDSAQNTQIPADSNLTDLKNDTHKAQYNEDPSFPNKTTNPAESYSEESTTDIAATSPGEDLTSEYEDNVTIPIQSSASDADNTKMEVLRQNQEMETTEIQMHIAITDTQNDEQIPDFEMPKMTEQIPDHGSIMDDEQSIPLSEAGSTEIQSMNNVIENKSSEIQGNQAISGTAAFDGVQRKELSLGTETAISEAHCPESENETGSSDNHEWSEQQSLENYLAKYNQSEVDSIQETHNQIDSSPEETHDLGQSFSDTATSSAASTVDMSEAEVETGNFDNYDAIDQASLSPVNFDENLSNSVFLNAPVQDQVKEHVPVYSDISDPDSRSSDIIEVGKELSTSFLGTVEEQSPPKRDDPAPEADSIRFPTRFSHFDHEAKPDNTSNSKVYMLMSNNSSVDISDIETDLSSGEVEEQRMERTKDGEVVVDSSVSRSGVPNESNDNEQATEQFQEEVVLSPEELIGTSGIDSHAPQPGEQVTSETVSDLTSWRIVGTRSLSEGEAKAYDRDYEPSHKNISTATEEARHHSMISEADNSLKNTLPDVQANRISSSFPVAENPNTIMDSLIPEDIVSVSYISASQHSQINNPGILVDPDNVYHKNIVPITPDTSVGSKICQANISGITNTLSNNEQDLTPETSSRESLNPNFQKPKPNSGEAERANECRDSPEDATRYGIHHRTKPITGTNYDYLDDQMPVLTVHATLVSVDDHPGVIDELRIDEIPILQPENTIDQPLTSRERNRTPIPLSAEKNLVLRNIFKGPNKGLNPVDTDTDSSELDRNVKEPDLGVSEPNLSVSEPNLGSEPGGIEAVQPKLPIRRTKRAIKPPSRLQRTNSVVKKPEKAKTTRTKACSVRLVRISESDILEHSKHSSVQQEREERSVSPDSARKKRSERRNSNSTHTKGNKSKGEDAATAVRPKSTGQSNQVKFKEFNIFDTPTPPKKKSQYVRPYVYDKELGNRRKSTSAAPVEESFKMSGGVSSEPEPRVETVVSAVSTQPKVDNTKSGGQSGSTETPPKRKYERTKSQNSSQSLHPSSHNSRRGHITEAKIVSEAQKGTFQIVNDPSERMKNFRIPMAPEYMRHPNPQPWSSLPLPSSRNQTVTSDQQSCSTNRFSAELDRLFPSPNSCYGNSIMSNTTGYSTSTDQQEVNKSYRFYPKDYHVQPTPTYSYYGRSYDTTNQAVSYQEQPFESIYNYKYPHENHQNSVMHTNPTHSHESFKQAQHVHPTSTYTGHQEPFSEENMNLTSLDRIFEDFAVNGITASGSDLERGNHVQSHSMSSHPMMYGELGTQAIVSNTESPPNKIIMVNDEPQPVYIEDVASYEELEYEDEEYDDNIGGTIRSPSREGRVYKRKRRVW